jgi:DNA uptake protein ComE-like DNA-binding protein
MLKEWLTYSKGERYGILILFILLVLMILYPTLQRTFFESSSGIHDAEMINRVDSFFLSLRYHNDQTSPTVTIADVEDVNVPKTELFPFDPNVASISELLRLGFSERQAQAIENLRRKGWRFQTAKDFAKVYVVDSLMYKRLEPFISIPPPDHPWQRQALRNDSLKRIRETYVVELNSADTNELVKLKGIGRGYARRIAAHRSLLGGYMSIEQLTDIYGITPELVESIRGNVRIDTMAAKRIYLNMVSYSDLKTHPYLTDYQARAIIYYRETKGNFVKINELVDYKLLDPKTFDKIRKYIILN